MKVCEVSLSFVVDSPIEWTLTTFLKQYIKPTEKHWNPDQCLVLKAIKMHTFASLTGLFIMWFQHLYQWCRTRVRTRTRVLILEDSDSDVNDSDSDTWDSGLGSKLPESSSSPLFLDSDLDSDRDDLTTTLIPIPTNISCHLELGTRLKTARVQLESTGFFFRSYCTYLEAN